MKIKVGYITSWRRAIFFSLIGFVLFVGFSRTISTSLLGVNLITNTISLLALLLGGFGFSYVCLGKRQYFEGEGTIKIQDGQVHYNDKKRHFVIMLAEIKKIDIAPITFRKQGQKPFAYQVIVVSGKKTYYIESEFIKDQSYKQVELYKLYLLLQEKNNERQEKDIR